MTRLSAHLDRVIDGGLIFLVAFTPLAFGTVETWSRAIAQGVIAAVFGAWVLKVAWGPAPLVIHLDADGHHGHASRGGRRRWRGLLGGRVVLSGIEWLAVLFVVVVAAQIVPLPAAWVATVSPRAAEIAAGSHPDGGSDGQLTVREMEGWLLVQSAGPLASALPAADGPQSSILPDTHLVSTTGSRTVSVSPDATRRKLEIFLAYLAIFVVGVNHWRDRRHADRIVVAIAITGTVIGVLGLLQRLTWSGRILWLREAPTDRMAWGPFVNHNHFAGYMEMALPVILGLGFLVYDEARLTRDPSERNLQLGRRVVPQMVLLAAGSLFGIAALLASGSRGGLLALLGAAACFLITAPRRPKGRSRWPLVVAGLVLLSAGALVAGRVGGEGWWEHYATLADPVGEPSFEFRLDTARRTAGMLRDFPVTGVGFGAFEAVYPAYASGERVRRVGAAHNDFIQVAAETGLVGAGLAMMAALVFGFRFLVPALRRTGSPRRHLVHGLGVGILALLLHSLWDFNLQIYSNGLLFVMIGALAVADRIARTPREVTNS